MQIVIPSTFDIRVRPRAGVPCVPRLSFGESSRMNRETLYMLLCKEVCTAQPRCCIALDWLAVEPCGHIVQWLPMHFGHSTWVLEANERTMLETVRPANSLRGAQRALIRRQVEIAKCGLHSAARSACCALLKRQRKLAGRQCRF